MSFNMWEYRENRSEVRGKR